MFSPILGLKAGTTAQQVTDRLQHQPQVFEFFLTPEDFTAAGWVNLEAQVARVQASGARIVFHHPMRYQDKRNELCVNQALHLEQYAFVMTTARRLIDLSKQVDGLTLVHGGYNQKGYDFIGDWPSLAQAQAVVLGRMCELNAEAAGHVVFENSISPICAFGDAAMEAQLLALRLPLAYDISHAFIYLHGDNDALVASLKHLAPLIRHYHLVDSMGQTHDSLPLGTGRVDWARVLPVLNPTASSIYEINLSNQEDCREMLASHAYLKQVARRLS